MSAKFDVFQQTFALSLLSNLASLYQATETYTPGNLPDPLETQLTNNIQTSLSSPIVTAVLGNDWKTVWGPAVWRREKACIVDNAAVVFYNPEVTFQDGTKAPTYVVAIAATNSLSTYDWFVEDFAVQHTVNWANYNPAVPVKTDLIGNNLTAHISKGTAVGVGHIAALTPTDPEHGTTSLANFISQLNATVSTGTRIVFTGHSLAGALAPTFALYLKEHGALSKFDQALTYPTAGATPGNAPFSHRFANTFAAPAAGTQPWQRWNTLVHNEYDIVPCGWNPDTLAKMRSIYGNSNAAGGVKLPEDIAKIIEVALLNSKLSGMTYTALPSAAFNPAAPEPIPATRRAYLNIAGTQHVNAYLTEILGPDFIFDGRGPAVPGVKKIGNTN